ncbi:MAG: L-histidine N(alpha)-methyltransferase [bacterium]
MELDTLTNLTQSRLKVKISRRDKSVESFAEDVERGLSSVPKTLPPKYFYDKRGSKIFEEICALPEYYPTRTESSILQKYATEIANLFDDRITLIELGSGNSVKTRLIIKAFLKRFKHLHYLPIDISKSILVESAKSLMKDYHRLKITAYVSEYHTALETLKYKNIGEKLILFLGSNIGNFEQREAEHFLKKTHAAMTENDRFLMGMDLKKDKSILEPAYNDARGVTAKFNLNLLVRINRELEGNFDLAKFQHKIIFDENLGRIEMHLESTARQIVTLRKINRDFKFERGETIHTENSYKYTMDQIKAMAIRNGFEVEKTWFDPQKWFSLNLLQPMV